MLSRIKGEIVWVCDGCEDQIDTATDDFEEARRDLRANNWITTKDGDEWKHFCSVGCKREALDGQG